MTMRKIILIAPIFTVLFISGYAQSVNLTVNLTEGFRYNTETTVNLTVEQEFMGILYNTQMDIVTVIQMQVQGIDADSNYILSASYQKMDIRVSSLLINMEVSTESVIRGDSLSNLLKALRGKEFKILLSRKGEIFDIIGLDEMINETILSGSLQEEQKIEFTRNLIQSLGKDAVLDNYRSIRSFYPDNPVKAHDQWDYHMNVIKSGIPMELNSNIRLKEITKEMAILGSEGRINSQNLKNEKNPAVLPSPVYYLLGNEISENKIDIRTGLLMESIVSQNITGTIKTPSEENNDQEMMIPFKIISRSTMLSTALQ